MVSSGVPDVLKRQTSLTGGDGLHFALAAHTSAVGRVDETVIVGGRLQVFHHHAGVAEGHVECLSAGLRLHQHVVELC